MMQVDFQNDPKLFLSRFGLALAQNEVEHNLILSLCTRAQKSKGEGKPFDIRFSTLSNDNEFVLTAVQTPPRNLVLSRARQPGNEEKLAEILAQHQAQFPGVIGPSDVSASFVNAWTVITGQKPTECLDQIIYSLTKVLFPPQVEGTFRFATAKETDIVAQWMQAFSKEALPKGEHSSDDSALTQAKERIADQAVAVWDVGGRPVAQALLAGTDAVARIGGVYTPAEQRGKGYASALVAHLSQYALDNGKRMCCLLADARNPVSNSIYRKIGYEFIGRSSHYIFGRGD